MSTREERIQVFQDTEKQCSSNQILKNAVDHSIEKQQFYFQKNPNETDCFRPYKLQFEDEMKIVVSKKRTFEAASGYKDQKIAVLNFASATNPGGGVVKGSSAQEECLCRCSTLYPCLNIQEAWDRFYAPHRKAADPIHNDDIIYTPEVVVFKTDTDKPVMMDEKDWYRTDVITCAAPNLKLNPTNKWNPGDGTEQVVLSDKELFNLQTERISRILDAAIMNDREVLILGAFGCGAFRNKPEIVAEAFRRILKVYSHAFKVVEFAIYCRGNETDNYKIFANKFRGR